METENKKSSSAIFSTPLFYAAALLMLLVGLGRGALWASEDRWAEIAREMLLTQDYFHPAINGEVYFDKPLLTYWMIVVVAKLFGNCGEFVVRLPGALTALAALAGVRFLGRRFWGREVGTLAGWLLLTSYGFIFWGRTAAADMANLTAVLLAVAWFFARKDQAGFGSYLVFYLFCFGGALAKGLPALVLPPVLVLAYVVMDGSWKKHLKISHFVAFFLGLGVFLAPYFIASHLPLPAGFHSPDSGLTGLELVWRENVTRVFNPFDHDDEPFYIYFVHVPRIMLPWVALLTAALFAVGSRWKRLTRETRWLLVAAGIVFVMFSASGSRRWYYILPIMPFLALLMAEYLAGDTRYPFRRGIMLFHRWVLVVVGIVGALALAAAPFVLKIDRIETLLTGVPRDVVWALPVAGVLTLALLRWKKVNLDARLGLPSGWGAIVAAVAVLIGSFFAVVYSGARELNTEKSFALRLKRELPAAKAADFAFYLKPLPKIVYYMRIDPPIPVLSDPVELRSHLAAASSPVLLFVEGRPKMLQELAAALPEIDIARPAYLEDRLAFENAKKRRIHGFRIEPGTVK